MILTPRLKLRSARADDLADLHAVLSDPIATTWWSTPPHADLAETEAWLASMMANGDQHPDFVIERDGVVIGKAGFYALPEIGYILHRDHWGHGFASEAATAVIDHVFVTTDLDELTADVDPDNAASIRLLERLGFVRTGYAERTWCIAGDWKNSFYYGLSRSDWSARPQAGTPLEL